MIQEIDLDDAVRVGGAEAVHPVTGLPVYRHHTSFEANRKLQIDEVFYDEWQVTDTGARVQEKFGLKYHVRNIIEISHLIPEVSHVVPAVTHLDESGNVVVDEPEYTVVDTPEQTVIDTPENNHFSKWYFYPLEARLDGLYANGTKIAGLDTPKAMGKDLIVYSINYTLANAIPFDAPSPYLIPQ